MVKIKGLMYNHTICCTFFYLTLAPVSFFLGAIFYTKIMFYKNGIKGTVAPVWIGLKVVFLDRPSYVYEPRMLNRFLNRFLKVVSIFKFKFQLSQRYIATRSVLPAIRGFRRQICMRGSIL
jgi:hypothetical protein